jgi:hypothetical protein
MCGACVDQDLAGPLPLTTTGTTAGRGNDHTMAPCGDGGASAPDVVLRWTAPAAGTYRFSTLGSSFDTILYARAIDCTGPILACNDDDPGGGLHSIFQLSLGAGQTVVLVLDGWGGGQGTYVLRIEAVMGGMGCGNGVCTAMESCATCPIDCGPCGFCGDFICDMAAGERCDTCPTDCGMCMMCGDGFCDAWAGETCTNCTIDCGACPPVCGNGSCDPGEGCLTCPGDCGVCPGTCGNGVCGPGETCASCQVDCGMCGGSCTHDVCLEGPPLVNGCSPCVTQVCAFDPFCCTAQWDGLCAEEAAMV